MDPRIRIDATIPVSRADYDAMADQRDEFRKLAYELKRELEHARSALVEVGRLVDMLDEEPEEDEPDFRDETKFELAQTLSSAQDSVTRTLQRCPKLTG